MNKHCDTKLVKVEQIDRIKTPWGLWYNLYEDARGNFFYDESDDTDQVIRSKAETADEALEELREYTKMMSEGIEE